MGGAGIVGVVIDLALGKGESGKSHPLSHPGMTAGMTSLASIYMHVHMHTRTRTHINLSWGHKMAATLYNRSKVDLYLPSLPASQQNSESEFLLSASSLLTSGETRLDRSPLWSPTVCNTSLQPRTGRLGSWTG